MNDRIEKIKKIENKMQRRKNVILWMRDSWYDVFANI